MRTIVKLLWIAFFGGIILIIAFIGLIYLGFFGELPDFERLENPEYNIASEVYTADGKLIGKYYIQDRSFVDFEDLPPHLIQALIATEDARFYEHHGIDWKGVVGAIVYTLQGKKRGGSTITQQLAKNLFPRQRFRTIPDIVITKLKEWITAVRLERSYTKDEIITMYFNTVPFGGTVYGIKSAAYTYFGKPVDSLTIEEAATLVGMLKATTKYNPVLNPESSRQRRNVVIQRMADVGFITQEEADSLKNLPLATNYTPITHVSGIAPYFREYLRKELNEFLKNYTKPDGTPYDLYTDGLRIYTTIDSRIQKYAEQAMKEHLSYMQKLFYKEQPPNRLWKEKRDLLVRVIKRTNRYRKLKEKGLSDDAIFDSLREPIPMKIFTWEGIVDTVMSPWDSVAHHLTIIQTGIIAIDNATGHIKAWVGGANFRFFQYDHVLARRQVGSTFKPIVYAVAIENGWSPCYEIPNMPVVFPEYDNWSPQNADKRYGEMLTLAQGLAYSINTVTAYIIKQFGPEAVIEMARRLGIKSEIPPVPSIALGTVELTPKELTGAYVPFATGGQYREPIGIIRIEDRYGNVIADFRSPSKQVLDQRTAGLMVALLQNVVNRGTGIRLRLKYKLPGAIGGKTGTTQEHADAWFIGFTPQITIGVWTGWDYPELHFKSMKYGQGASMALPIWALLMKKVFADKELYYKPTAQFEFLKPEWIANQHCLYNWRSLRKTRDESTTPEDVIIF
ncbi:MAG: PBP1A family penicillin-binding protein [Chlorobi bacterium]|nr:PBP1A family penicillin-binding protein [Chlorobiota bacterium]